MARRKVGSEAATPASRSTASIFKQEQEPSDSDNVDEPKPETVAIENGPPQSFDPIDVEEAKFPVKQLYEFQDFVNNHMSFRKGAQLLVVLYLGQIFYLHYLKVEGLDIFSTIGSNLFGALVAIYLSHRSLTKKYKADPERYSEPKLPSFNIVYSFFIPYLVVLLMCNPSDPFFQVNLSMTNFAIKSLHPVAKTLSAFVYTYMFSDENTVDLFKFGQLVWIYFAFDFALNSWNEEVFEDKDGEIRTRHTMNATEIHLISTLAVNLLLNFTPELLEATAPMFIVRILLIALVLACSAAYPIYFAHQSMDAGTGRSVVAAVVVSVFSSVFYYVANYLFRTQVYDKEVLHWLWDFVFSSDLHKKLMLIWVVTLAITVPVVFVLSHKNIIGLNVRRKLWHFILTASMAYPALVQAPSFSALAVLGSVFVFLIVEFVRCSDITFVGGLLRSQLRIFQDDKDLRGPLNLSYIFLLVGVAIPIGYGVLLGDIVSLRSYIGLVTLGLGDSIASIVGINFGRTKWKGGSRTLEGTLAYIAVTFFSFIAIDYWFLPDTSRVQNWENIFIVALVAGIIEGAAFMNDNILIPCMSLITYELLNRAYS